jgi:DNA-binding CsgD family transcriptional regulator
MVLPATVVVKRAKPCYLILLYSNPVMATVLSIQVCSPAVAASEEIKFFGADDWSQDSEQELLLKIRDALAMVRGMCKSCEIKINLEVNDFRTAVFILKKKISSHVEINNQKLSLREIEVLALIMRGMTNNEIAEKLFISFETVRSHRKHILEKTGAKNTASLINHYHQTFFEK